MIRFRSILSRIIGLHVLAVTITLLVTPLALSWFLSSATSSLHDRAMREQAGLLAEHLILREDGSWTFALPREMQNLYSASYARYFYAILDENGHVLFSSVPGAAPVFENTATKSISQALQASGAPRTISGVGVPLEVAGRSILVQVAEDLGHRDVIIDDLVRDFFARVGWITIPILLVLLLFDILLFRRALHPVVLASDQARKISPSRTDLRLPTAGIPAEILPLVSAVNDAFARLEHGLQAQREFSANVAHELRTPLAILRTRIDTLSDQLLAASLRKDVEGMTRVVGQLLAMAELDSFVPDASESADLRQVCATVAEDMAPLALREGKAVSMSAPPEPVVVLGDGELLYRAIRNLAENAIAHTPHDSEVEFVVSQSGTVSVLDQGPGVAEGDREFLFRRFWRRNGRRGGGAGLGLAIVGQIAELHYASVAVSNRPSGGACFTLSFQTPEFPSKGDLGQSVRNLDQKWP